MNLNEKHTRAFHPTNRQQQRPRCLMEDLDSHCFMAAGVVVADFQEGELVMVAVDMSKSWQEILLKKRILVEC
jgi:hypothetical protein